MCKLYECDEEKIFTKNYQLTCSEEMEEPLSEIKLLWMHFRIDSGCSRH